MKIKSLMMLTLLSMLSVNAFALEGQGFRVLSHTVEISKGTVGGFVDHGSPSSSKSFFAQAWSQGHDMEGRVSQNLRLWGNHSFNITNYTSQRQTYSYKYELNCDSQFARQIDHLEITPGGYATNSADSYLYTQHYSPGSWTINVVTEVKGESSNTHVATGLLRVTA